MVAFCQHCSQSLPYADVEIKKGEEVPAPGVICPNCEEVAGEEEQNTADFGEDLEDIEELSLDDDEDMIIEKGEEQIEEHRETSENAEQ